MEMSCFYQGYTLPEYCALAELGANRLDRILGLPCHHSPCMDTPQSLTSCLFSVGLLHVHLGHLIRLLFF